MKSTLRWLAMVVVTTLLLIPLDAHAQTAPPITAGPNLTPAVGVIAALSMLAGVLTNWIQTGTLLGRWITPKTWLPDLTLISTWLGGFVGYLASQNPPSLSGASLFWATLTAIGTLTAGATPAAAHYAHSSLNAKTRELLRLATKTAAMLLAVGTLVVSQAACKQPVLPLIAQIGNVVLTDLQQGKTDVQIDSDVCGALGGSATTDAVCANVTLLINDAIQFLIDSGQLNGVALERGQSYMAAHLVAAKGGK
jgi:hypothetical protein